MKHRSRNGNKKLGNHKQGINVSEIGRNQDR